MSANLATSQGEYSRTSESAFMRLVDDIGRTLEPTQTQLETLERSYLSTGEFLANCEEFKGHLEEIHPHGSRALGTMTRPLRDREGFDIDLMARLNQDAWQAYSGINGASLLLSRLHQAVDRYATQHRLKVVKWQRCVTLEYADGMCADIAPVIEKPHLTALHGDSHGYIPDRELRSFHPTNPRGFIRLFDSIAAIKPNFARESMEAMSMDSKRAEIVPLPAPEVFERLLCRLIQMMKLHRDMAFSSEPMAEFSPSSIFITALAAGAYQQKAPLPHRDQVDLLFDVIRTMPTLIRKQVFGYGQEEWTVDNPTAPGDNLASAMNTRERQHAFYQWHGKLMEDVGALLQTIEGRQGLDKVATMVAAVFGDKAAASVRSEEKTRQTVSRGVGQVATVTAAGIVLPMPARGHTFFGE